MEVLLLDNHDSFTHNIAHIVREDSSVNLQIITSDNIVLEEIEYFDRIIFSPGPDIPAKGNIMERVLDRYKESTPILGICLGLQAIVTYFGGNLKRLDEVVHGRTKRVFQTNESTTIFQNIPSEFEAGLYHSWIADAESLPESILVTAISGEGRIMAIKHKFLDIEAVQFHPESIMTPYGSKMIYNWLRIPHKVKRPCNAISKTI